MNVPTLRIRTNDKTTTQQRFSTVKLIANGCVTLTPKCIKIRFQAGLCLDLLRQQSQASWLDLG